MNSSLSSSQPQAELPSDPRARGFLLERGGAEMLRARRYGRDLGLVSVALKAASPRANALAAEVFMAVVRTGVDDVVPLHDGTLAALLPETALAGTIHLAARVQQKMVMCGLDARVGFAALDPDDNRFLDMLARAERMLVGED